MNLLEPRHFNFLKEISIFKQLDDKELKQVVRILKPREVAKGETVFSRLEKERILYIVRYGSLKLELAGSDNKTFNKGDVFGEIAFINSTFRTGTIVATEPSLLFQIDGHDVASINQISAEAALKVVVELAKMITSYLVNAQNTSTQSLIEQGENEFVEFKSSLRYNIHTGKFGKEIEHASLKTIAAFLNSSGGTLIIGVDDNRKILGLEPDKFKDDDHLLLHLSNIIQEKISMEHMQFIKGTVESSNGLKVLRVDVKPATTPAYLEYKNAEIFYIRTGPATSQMRVSEIYSYVKDRFHK